MKRRASSLELLHGGDVGGLDKVLEVVGDLVLEVLERDLGVLDDEVDLEHLDAVADGDELGGTPQEAVHLNGTDTVLELLHVGLVVPRLNLEGDDRLGDLEGLAGGKLLLLLGLLDLVVLGDTLGLDTLGLLVNLVVRAEEVNVLVVLLLGGGGGTSGGLDAGEGDLARSKRRGLAGVRSDVLVPAGGVGLLDVACGLAVAMRTSVGEWRGQGMAEGVDGARQDRRHAGPSHSSPADSTASPCHSTLATRRARLTELEGLEDGNVSRRGGVARLSAPFLANGSNGKFGKRKNQIVWKGLCLQRSGEGS
jgi:hypothetical protein